METTPPSEPDKKLPEIKVEPPKNEDDTKKSKEKTIEQTKSGVIIEYSNRQKKIAQGMYISIVVAALITIIGAVWNIANLFQAEGKWEAFLAASTGFKIVVIGGIFAGLLFFVILFYGLAKKGINVILRITFKKREKMEKVEGKMTAKIGATAIMLCIFAVIIGFFYLLVDELVFNGSTSSLGTYLETLILYDQGLLVLYIGIALLALNGLIFALNFLYYNGYYLLLKMIGGLEKLE